MEKKAIVHVESGEILIPQAKWCNSFGRKLRGFTFQRELQPEDGLVLVETKDNRAQTAIHMLFVFFNLGVIWVNNAGEVVGTVVAQPWRLSYLPPAPARYVIEGQPDLVNRVTVGDHIKFVDPPESGSPN